MSREFDLDARGVVSQLGGQQAVQSGLVAVERALRILCEAFCLCEKNKFCYNHYPCSNFQTFKWVPCRFKSF